MTKVNLDKVSTEAIKLYDAFQASFENWNFAGGTPPTLLDEDSNYLIAATISSDVELDIFDRFRHLVLILDDEIGRLDFLIAYDCETLAIRNFTLLADCTYTAIPV